MKVTVVGLGYIGLPTALMMAANGVQIVGVDKKEELLETTANLVYHYTENRFDLYRFPPWISCNRSQCNIN